MSVAEFVNQNALVIRFQTVGLESGFVFACGGIEINRDAVVAITGGIGCGKTQLIETILGVRSRNGFRVWRKGIELTPEEILTVPFASYAPQSPGIFTLSILENISLGRAVLPQTLDRACAITGLETDVAHFPNGLNTLVGPGGMSVSDGQRRRIGIARALCTDHELLVLDDPCRAIDDITARNMMGEIIKQRRGAVLIADSGSPVALQIQSRYILDDQRRLLHCAAEPMKVTGP